MNTQQNRYEVIETLGMGATSRVDKAYDTVIGRTVALKTFLRGFGSRDLEQQFLREAQIIGGLSHPNIIALYDVGKNKDGAPYLVMEYVEGKTLETIFEAGPLPLPLPRVAAWAGDLATALGQAHRAKIIHGDVKPANILVTSESQVKLGDFGIAHFSTQISGSGILMGTPGYLAPEQILANLQDSRSDFFSLGIVLYQMSTGVRPFDGDSVDAVCAQIISSAPPPPSHHNPSLPPAFDQLVMRCLSKNPEDRYPTAEALAAAVYPFARTSHAAPSRSYSAATPRAMISWWSQPFQHKDMWTAASLIFLISLVASVPALRKHCILRLTAFSAIVHPSDVTPTRGTPPESAANSMTSFNSSAIADSPLTDSSSSTTKPDLQPPRMPAPSASKTSRLAKSPATRRQAATFAPALTRDASVGQPPATAPSANAQPPLPKQLTSLRVEIVSAIAEETIAVYAGDHVLISTRLDSARLGEPLRFDCPLSPGVHPLRVALYRADESLHIQKEGFADIVSDDSNTLNIRVSRRSKLLIRKEIALEVTWPNPHSAAAQYTSSLAPVR